MNSDDQELLAEVRSLLGEGRPTEAALAAALDRSLSALDCQLATLHRHDAAENMLLLVGERNLPAPMLGLVARIPVGKGIAGLAAERREPVSLCNLQTDTSGDARPGARATGMEGSICIPVLVDGELLGTFGVAKTEAHEFDAEEIARLEALGACFVPALGA